MVWIVILAAAVSQAGPAIAESHVFSLFDRYNSSFEDVAFVYEGSESNITKDDGSHELSNRFQGFCAYRNDGATLLDIFSHHRRDGPVGRSLYSLLGHRLEVLDASPDGSPPVRNREPLTGVGGPGTLNRQDAPLKIFLPWYLSRLHDPADYEVQNKGWEDVDGHRCLKLRMLQYRRPDLKSWVGAIPFIQLWVDTARNGYPLRNELYRGDDLETRTEISRLEQVRLPSGRAIWFPAEGTFRQYVQHKAGGKPIHSKEPVYVATYLVLINTVKFNQSLSDGFFSVKEHALVTSDEGLTRLLRKLGQKPTTKPKSPPSDPDSRRKRLDEALIEADRQAEATDASSAARAGSGWFGALYGGLGVFGVMMLAPLDSGTGGTGDQARLWVCLLASAFGPAGRSQAGDESPGAQSLDCGTMALYQLLHLESRPISLGELKSLLPRPGQDGHSLLELRKSGGQIGASTGRRCTSETAISNRWACPSVFENGERGPLRGRPSGRPHGHVDSGNQDGEREPSVFDVERLFASPYWTGIALVPRRNNYLALGAGGIAVVSFVALGARTWKRRVAPQLTGRRTGDE